MQLLYIHVSLTSKQRSPKMLTITNLGFAGKNIRLCDLLLEELTTRLRSKRGFLGTLLVCDSKRRKTITSLCPLLSILHGHSYSLIISVLLRDKSFPA